MIFPFRRRSAKKYDENEIRELSRRLNYVMQHGHLRAVLEQANVLDAAERLQVNLKSVVHLLGYGPRALEQTEKRKAALALSEVDLGTVFDVIEDDIEGHAQRLSEERSREELRIYQERQQAQRELMKRNAGQDKKAPAPSGSSPQHMDRATKYRQERLERQRRERADQAAKRGASDVSATVHMGSKAWEAAEHLAAAYLRDHGYPDAQVTPPGNDKGLDVVGRAVTGQVKYLARPVGAPMLQQAVGASSGREVVFFSRSGYSPAGVEYATVEEIALFTIELPDTVRPINRRARFIADGV